MFVWLPNFAMTRARLKQPPLAKPNEPLALLEKCGNVRHIAALDKPAMQAGLYLHQPLADALAVYPSLICADAEPEADRHALKALTLWAHRYSPWTAPAPPCGLWLDITGCGQLWGGEDKLAEDLLLKLKAQGIPAKAAIAPTFGAAYALAYHAHRYTIVAAGSPFPPKRGSVPEKSASTVEWIPASTGMPLEICGRLAHKERIILRGETIGKLSALLAPLPVERLRISTETASVLRKLGLFAIKDVQNLPRKALAKRFPDLLSQLDKATGLAEEAIEFLRPATPWLEQLKFAEPISAPEDIERATLKLLEMLCARLEAQHRGGLQFEVSFFRADGEVQTQAISTALPSRDAAKIFRLFRERLQHIDPGFGIDVVLIEASQTASLEPYQNELVTKSKQAASLQDLAALIDSLENRLGVGCVYRLSPQESYIPERAVKRTAPLPSPPSFPKGRRDTVARVATYTLTHGERNGMRGDKLWQRMGERPIRLLTRPQPIEVTAMLPDAPPILFRWRKVVHRITRADGPERIAPEWWRSRYETFENAEVRDYYCVESSHGMRFWIFREGIYGGDRLPRWYLHGVFP